MKHAAKMIAPGTLLGRSWYAPGAHLVRSWGTLRVRSSGTLLVRFWYAPGTFLVRSWSAPGAFLGYAPGTFLVRYVPEYVSGTFLGTLLVRA